jgi:hypothetical protein
VLTYLLLRFAKFAGVLAFAGGAIGALVARDLDARRALVHRVASSGLLVLWVAGVLLAQRLGRPWSELWVLAAFAATFVVQGALTWRAARAENGGPGVVVVVVGLLAVSLWLMIWRPTWAMVGL